ncbi:MAG: hypothetical protein D6714_19870, partial [Bacteroidetes bacterium]
MKLERKTFLIPGELKTKPLWLNIEKMLWNVPPMERAFLKPFRIKNLFRTKDFFGFVRHFP